MSARAYIDCGGGGGAVDGRFRSCLPKLRGDDIRRRLLATGECAKQWCRYQELTSGSTNDEMIHTEPTRAS
jgi:hypothetical protein